MITFNHGYKRSENCLIQRINTIVSCNLRELINTEMYYAFDLFFFFYTIVRFDVCATSRYVSRNLFNCSMQLLPLYAFMMEIPLLSATACFINIERRTHSYSISYTFKHFLFVCLQRFWVHHIRRSCQRRQSAGTRQSRAGRQESK